LVCVKSRARLFAAAFALGTTPVLLSSALAAEKSIPADVPLFVTVTPPQTGYSIQRVGNQGVKLTSKNAVNSYAITVLGSNAEAKNAPAGAAEAWQKSVGVEVEGKLGSYVKTDVTTRFTRLESSPDFGPYRSQSAEGPGTDRRALQEYSITTQFLGDRVAVSSSRRASDYAGLDPTLDRKGGTSEQEKFNAWIWRSQNSSLSIEGSSNRVETGFQNLSQAMHTRNEESQQLKSKLSYGRAGVFVAQRDSAALAPDRTTELSRQTGLETGATLGLSDLRQKGTLSSLLPDSVWVSTNHGSIGQGDTVGYEKRPMEKSAVGMSRTWDAGTLNVSYWRSSVDGPATLAEESLWRGQGMDVGGTLKSGRLSMSGNLSFYTSDNIVALNNSAESNLNGSLFLTYSRAAWPKVSAGVTNYAYQAVYFDYSGLNQNSMMRYEVGVDSTPLLSAWRDPGAQLKFIASYQDTSSLSQWAQAPDTATAAQNVFFGFKFTRSLLAW
jgi:hypothetical protein